jgi:hypothetical protein
MEKHEILLGGSSKQFVQNYGQLDGDFGVFTHRSQKISPFDDEQLGIRYSDGVRRSRPAKKHVNLAENISIPDNFERPIFRRRTRLADRCAWD